MWIEKVRAEGFRLLHNVEIMLEDRGLQMSDDAIHIELFTKHSHNEFFKGDAFVNESGNVCIYFDEKNFAVLTPKMAKRLSTRLDEASRQALADHLSE